MTRTISAIVIACIFAIPVGAWAVDTQSGEKAVSAEMKKLIPPDKIKGVDDLYRKWQEVQAGKSKATIIDLRTEAEFNSGHIKNSNNIDSGHAYTIPDKWADPETEMWVLCRTANRAIYFVGTLYKYGYRNVYLVDKGIVGWSEKGYPLVNTYLGEIKVVKYDKKLKETFAYRENK
ncbi:MAG: rhodanese-like domain-containing protein [Desulfoprunum sp.]|nr:rhodanese-like domain-containing protein [Desulfoprunum sp.]